MINNNNFITLELFAKRFNLERKNIAWGIGRIIRNDILVFPVVLIKNNQTAYIDISKDAICHNGNDGATPMFFEEALLSEVGDEYVFTSSNCQTTLKKEQVEKFYADKVFSSATEKYVLGME
ncbi:MAG: hypothetical protein PHE89_02140 [Alphaproteobacteria bacterium]|nr:hypothetical protein [Alphaproteobacteria bacterium]